MDWPPEQLNSDMQPTRARPINQAEVCTFFAAAAAYQLEWRLSSRVAPPDMVDYVRGATSKPVVEVEVKRRTCESN